MGTKRFAQYGRWTFLIGWGNTSGERQESLRRATSHIFSIHSASVTHRVFSAWYRRLESPVQISAVGCNCRLGAYKNTGMSVPPNATRSRHGDIRAMAGWVRGLLRAVSHFFSILLTSRRCGVLTFTGWIPHVVIEGGISILPSKSWVNLTVKLKVPMDSHAVPAAKSGDLLEAVQASDIPKRDERVIPCRHWQWH